MREFGALDSGFDVRRRHLRHPVAGPDAGAPDVRRHHQLLGGVAEDEVVGRQRFEVDDVAPAGVDENCVLRHPAKRIDVPAGLSREWDVQRHEVAVREQLRPVDEGGVDPDVGKVGLPRRAGLQHVHPEPGGAPRDRDPPFGGCCQVNVVVPHRERADEREVGQGVQHVGVDVVGEETRQPLGVKCREPLFDV